MFDNGLKKTGIAHHHTRLKELLSWLGDDTTVTAQRLMDNTSLTASLRDNPISERAAMAEERKCP